MHCFLQGTFDLLTVQKEIKQNMFSINNLHTTGINANLNYTLVARPSEIHVCATISSTSFIYIGGRKKQSGNNIDFFKNVFIKELLPTLSPLKKSEK